MKSNLKARGSAVAPVMLGTPIPMSTSMEPRRSSSTPYGAKASRVIFCTGRRMMFMRLGRWTMDDRRWKEVRFYRPSSVVHRLPIYFPEHDVERADDGDHVGDEV